MSLMPQLPDSPVPPEDRPSLIPPAIKSFRPPLLRVILVGLLAALAVATVVVLTGGEDSPAVVIVESGFSPVTQNEGANEAISWAAIVENTSDEVVHNVRLQITYRDAAGGADDSYLRDIDELRPGERIGVGGTVRRSTGVTDFELDFELEPDMVETFEPPSGTGSDQDGITLDDVWVGHRPDELTVAFSAEIDTRSPLEVMIHAIFRDADGKIVGGVSRELIEPLQPERPNSAHIVITDMELPHVDTVELYASSA